MSVCSPMHCGRVSPAVFITVAFPFFFNFYLASTICKLIMSTVNMIVVGKVNGIGRSVGSFK